MRADIVEPWALDLLPHLSHTKTPLPVFHLLIPRPVFAGKDASRALGMTSTKLEDVKPEWKDLPDKEKGVLNDWIKFFSNRYNVVGVVEGATNFDDEPVATEAPAAQASSS